MSNQQPINVTVQTSGREGQRIVATILLFGGLGAVMWAFGQGPIGEYASIVASAALMYFARRQWRRGVGADAAAPDTSGGATLAQSLAAGLASQRGGTPALLGQSLLVGLAFLLARELISIVMHPVIGASAVYVSIVTTAALSFLGQHLVQRRYGRAPIDRGGVTSWVSLPGEDWQQHLWRLGRELTGGGDGYLRRCHPVVLAAASVAYGLVSLGVRQALVTAMHLMSNLVLAVGVSAVLGSVLVLPTLVPEMMRRLRDRTPTTDAAQTPVTAQVLPVQAAPAPVVEPPVAPTPPKKVVRRVEQPAPTPTPKKVVRVVKKKENTDV
ncbi:MULTISPECIES: hypothetical protein [Gordonia]|uniref:hypothetical protein n=1 Tax=Gordonia TaxID=2053 RepID=UPI00257996ED|nr:MULTISPECIES: hypothetical protein [Gordonia]